jgi:hypothetical protein
MEAVFFEWLYMLDLVINLEHLIIGWLSVYCFKFYAIGMSLRDLLSF